MHNVCMQMAAINCIVNGYISFNSLPTLRHTVCHQWKEQQRRRTSGSISSKAFQMAIAMLRTDFLMWGSIGSKFNNWKYI